MILWTIKLYGFVRKAIAGRRHPGQLAWAVAFGLLLGIVPHGNLLAIILLVVVLSLKLNHAMAMLTAVGASFVAMRLDPVSHAVGQYLHAQPKFSEMASKAWELPMMPWTDLNNTVVLGSLTIGLTALIPVFMVTYPLFRLFAPKAEANDDQEALEPSQDHDPTPRQPRDRIVYVDRASEQVPAPHRDRPAPRQPTVQPSSERVDFVELSPETTTTTNHATTRPASDASIETRIDVIRIKESSEVSPTQGTSATPSPDPNEPPQPMDEALNYLLRQLRDSQQRNAA